MIHTLTELLNHFRISSWDALLIGDGSGSAWAQPSGWACTLIDAASRARRLFGGAASDMSIGVAEVMPYFHAMLWYAHDVGKARVKLRMPLKQRVQVHIVTDSQYAANAGNRACVRNANKMLWAAMDSLYDYGYELTWHHLGRQSVDMNVLMDAVSREYRFLFCGHDTLPAACQQIRNEVAPNFPDVDIYQLLT